MGLAAWHLRERKLQPSLISQELKASSRPNSRLGTALEPAAAVETAWTPGTRQTNASGTHLRRRLGSSRRPDEAGGPFGATGRRGPAGPTQGF